MKTRILKWGMFLAIGLLYHCQQDDLRLEDPTHAHQLQQLSSRTVSLKELPKLADFVSRQISSSHHRMANKSYAITPFGNVDVEVITEVIDVYGNANYTFALIPNHLYENTFFNLVIYYSPDLDSIQSYVVEYAMTEEFATSYSNGTKHLGQFTGSIKYYDTQAFLAMDQKSLSRTNNCEEDDTNDMDEAVTACEEIVVVDGQAGTSEDDTNSDPDGDDAVDNSNSGGSTSTSDGSGNVSSGGGGQMIKFCNFIGVYTMNCGGTNSNALHLASTCQGPDIASATFFNGYDCGGGNLVFDPIKSSACGSTGTAAIIPVPFYKLSLALGLNTAESECLDNHCELKNQIYDYLNAHRDDDGDYQEEALNFVSAVIDELTDTCETDFEVDFDEERINGIKLDSTLPSCAKSIVLDLMLGNFPYSENMGNIELIEEVFEELGSGSSNGGIPFVTTYKMSNITGNGVTTASYDADSQQFIATVTIDEDLINNGTILAIVKTVLHESIHAYLLYLQQQYPIYFGNSSEFSQLISDYAAYTDANDPQHIYMASIITEMSNNISNFVQEKYFYPQATSDYYEAVCWSGITHLSNGTLNPIFSNNYPNPNDQNNIIKIFNTENGTATYPGYDPLIDNNCN